MPLCVQTTKRILAILTAIVLCLAPMALMVGMAENTVVPHWYKMLPTADITVPIAVWKKRGNSLN